MARYDLYLHNELLDTLPKGGTRRRKVMAFILGLREYPEVPSDFTEVGPTGRAYQGKIIGKHAVLYWLDHAVKTVVVVEVRPADR